MTATIHHITDDVRKAFRELCEVRSELAAARALRDEMEVRRLKRREKEAAQNMGRKAG